MPERPPIRAAGHLAAAALAVACGAPGPVPATPDGSATFELPAAQKTFRLERRGARPSARPAPLLEILSAELGRAASALGKADPAVYYLAYTVTDRSRLVIAASSGSLSSSRRTRERSLDVDLRVGDRHLDNTHLSENLGRFDGAAQLALDDQEAALDAALWLATDAAYQRAQGDLVSARAGRRIEVAERDASDDFSVEPPHQHFEEPVTPRVDAAGWERRVRDASGWLAAAPAAQRSRAALPTSIAAPDLLVRDADVRRSREPLPKPPVLAPPPR